MVLSRTALQLIAANCRCPAPDTPDDMWLGACSESLGISIVHFSGFHQVVWRLLLSPIEVKDDQCYFCFFFFLKQKSRPDRMTIRWSCYTRNLLFPSINTGCTILYKCTKHGSLMKMIFQFPHLSMVTMAVPWWIHRSIVRWSNSPPSCFRAPA